MALKILNIKNECTACGACVSACAKEAIKLEYDKEGFYFPQVNTELCIECRLCEKVCHALNKPIAKSVDRRHTPYMLKSKDEKLVQKSSSGAVFSLIANEVLKEGGIVYGARYNYETERLEHCSTDECSLDELRKSKYIESYLGDTFANVRKQLLNKRKVFFCGTPCQVKGLLTYLEVKKTDTENLLTARFVCHGVPSNKFFTEYKHWKEAKAGSKIIGIDFRPKTRGWSTSNIVLTLQNGEKIDEIYKENHYYLWFQKNLFLRRSCYNCKMLNEICGDITIGDFWGILKYKPELNDEKGCSLVFEHSEKARKIIDSINCELKFIEKIPQEAINYVYNEVDGKEGYKNERDALTNDIIKNGHNKTAIKISSKEISKYKIKIKIVRILKSLGIWEKIKK